MYTNAASHAGITITLEKTNGLLSSVALVAAQDIAEAPDVVAATRVVENVRAAALVTQTGADGKYTFSGVAPGIYTVYASSANSMEKAVTTNAVTVEAGRAVTAADLNLTPVGRISGHITIDNSATNNAGFLISVAGTSYMAMTGNGGAFTISDVPAGNNYTIMITKGTYTTVYSSTMVSVTGGQITTLSPNPRDIRSSALESGGIAWKGALSVAPAYPETNWAYYNTVSKISFIFSGSNWEILAVSGENGTGGSMPYIGIDGYWYINSQNTYVPATGPQGESGVTPTVTIGNDGYWYINGVNTGVLAQGPQGEKGKDGNTGTLGSVVTIGENGNWFINGADTGKSSLGSQGEKGVSGTPGSVVTIGGNGNWFIDGVDTGKPSRGTQGEQGPQGEQGEPGTPGQNGKNGTLGSVITIGDDGYWYIDGEKTDTKAEGSEVVIGENGNWFIDGVDTGKPSRGLQGEQGPQGEPGKNGEPETTPSYTVIFNSNGGGTIPSQTVLQGEKVAAPSKPVKGSLYFGGWYKENTLKNKWVFTSDTVNANVTLYAKWNSTFVVASIEDIIEFLGGKNGTLANPVRLAIEIDLGAVHQTDSGWRNLLEALAVTQDYVVLDLSACTMDGTHFLHNNETAVNGMDRIVDIVLPAKITFIGEYTFYWCTNLVLASLPAGITFIGEYAFYWCYNLALTSLPSGITSIGNYAFDGCESLVSITLPATITSIGNSAFNSGSGGTIVECICLAVSPPIGSQMFIKSDGVPYPNLVIKVPATSVATYKAALGWGYYADSIVAIQ